MLTRKESFMFIVIIELILLIIGIYKVKLYAKKLSYPSNKIQYKSSHQYSHLKYRESHK